MTAHDREVLSLTASGNGRSCGQHGCCGGVVVPNDIFCFKLTIIDWIGGGKEVDNNNNTVQEEAIKSSSCLGGH